MKSRQLVTGTWRGRYSYDPAGDFSPAGADFTMHLECGWLFGRITGSCVDDDAVLASDPPKVSGRVRGHRITLAKHYGEFWVMSPDGTLTLRQWLAKSGVVTPSYIPPQVVRYDGQIDLRTGLAKGRWSLRGEVLRLRVNAQDYVLPALAASGTWIMQKM